jgi:hypothetical protein
MGLETGSKPFPRLLLNQLEAAAACSVSVDTFAAHIAPELRRVRCGRPWLYPLGELNRWIERNAVKWPGG